jgi:hypothetical protein
MAAGTGSEAEDCVLASGVPLASLLDGAIPAVAIVIAGAAVRQVNKRRQNKAEGDTDVRKRLKSVESDIRLLKDGLFGEVTPFGKKPGFVDEVRETLGILLREATPNGGHSQRDDITAMRKVIAPHEGDADARS